MFYILNQIHVFFIQKRDASFTHRSSDILFWKSQPEASGLTPRRRSFNIREEGVLPGSAELTDCYKGNKQVLTAPADFW